MIVVVCVLCLLSVCKLETFTTVLDIIRRVIVLACVYCPILYVCASIARTAICHICNVQIISH